MIRLRSLILPVAIISSTTSLCARADTLWVGSLERKNVRIQNFRNGQVEFSIDGRPAEPQPAEKVSRLALDDEPVFSKADQSYAEGRFADAADGYQAAMKSTAKAWLKDWMLPRMLMAADRGGRFDLAVASFVELLQKDPTVATRLRPKPPEQVQANALSSAAAELAREASNANLSAAQKQAILSLQMDVLRAQGDLAGASKVADQLLKMAGGESNDPAAKRTLADVHIGIARLAIAQKDYAKAIGEISNNQAIFIDPSQQVEALYCLAAAKDAQAGTAGASDDAIKDVAIEYMRVVALARTTPEKRHLPESLVRVAEIQEKLGDDKAALALYGEVVSEYKDGPVAAKALKQQQHLKQKAGM